MKKLYIVTGGSGLVGTNLINKLLSLKEDSDIIALQHNNIIKISSPRLKIINGDVCDMKSLDNLFNVTGYEKKICIHCAGIITISSKNSDNVYNVNVNGTKNIIIMCQKYKISKLIYISSVHTIPVSLKGTLMTEITDFDPNKLNGVYAKTKAIATKMVLESTKNGLNTVVVQPSGIIGPYDYYEGNFTSLILSYLKNKLPLIVTGGYDFVDVRDVVNGIVGAINYGRNGECYILTNKYYSVQELINILAKVTSKKPIKLKISRFIITPLAPIAEFYYSITKQKPLFTAYSLKVLKDNAMFSHEKASRELGYTTRSLEVTLEDTVDWLKQVNKI